jgi:hypothetical protein
MMLRLASTETLRRHDIEDACRLLIAQARPRSQQDTYPSGAFACCPTNYCYARAESCFAQRYGKLRNRQVQDGLEDVKATWLPARCKTDPWTVRTKLYRVALMMHSCNKHA